MSFIAAILFMSAMGFGGYNLQERYELCKLDKNKDQKECDIFYKEECVCRIKTCEKKLIKSK
jgi:hypothetical protein